MVCHFWHQFLTQFSLLFQMVPFFFLSMAALRTTNTKLSDWLLELFQPIRLWLSELPYRARWMVPSERALKTEPETCVKPFCWGSSLRKTNSGGLSFSKCGNEWAPSSVALSLVPKQQTKIKSVEFISNLLPARLTMKTPVGARQIQQQKRRICRAMNLLQGRQPSQSVMFWISWNTPSF